MLLYIVHVSVNKIIKKSLGRQAFQVSVSLSKSLSRRVAFCRRKDGQVLGSAKCSACSTEETSTPTAGVLHGFTYDPESEGSLRANI